MRSARSIATLALVILASVSASEARAQDSSFPFVLGSPIHLRESPITAQRALFKVKDGGLELELEATCAKGKDQIVTIEVEILDQEGVVIGALFGQGGVEEGKSGKIKAKDPGMAHLIGKASAFRIKVTSRPD